MGGASGSHRRRTLSRYFVASAIPGRRSCRVARYDLQLDSSAFGHRRQSRASRGSCAGKRLVAILLDIALRNWRSSVNVYASGGNKVPPRQSIAGARSVASSLKNVRTWRELTWTTEAPMPVLKAGLDANLLECLTIILTVITTDLFPVLSSDSTRSGGCDHLPASLRAGPDGAPHVVRFPV